LSAEWKKEKKENPASLSGSFFVLCVPAGLQGQGREVGDDVVEHPHGPGEAFVVVVLLELVFGNAPGDGGVYEGVIADEDAYMADTVASAGLEKYQVAGLEFAALDLLPDAGHFNRGAGKFRVEHPVVHEPYKSGAVESFRTLSAEAVPDAEKLPDVAEKAPHGTGGLFGAGLDETLFRRWSCKTVGRRSEENRGREKEKEAK